MNVLSGVLYAVGPLRIPTYKSWVGTELHRIGFSQARGRARGRGGEGGEWAEVGGLNSPPPPHPSHPLLHCFMGGIVNWSGRKGLRFEVRAEVVKKAKKHEVVSLGDVVYRHVCAYVCVCAAPRCP